jgi:hypothetical protein
VKLAEFLRHSRFLEALDKVDQDPAEFTALPLATVEPEVGIRLQAKAYKALL